MANKDKKNKTSFDVGNKAAEKWTLIEAENKFIEIRANAEINTEVLCLQDAYLKIGMYGSTFHYLIEKFPVLEIYKKDITDIVVSRINKNALQNKFNATASIWRMKQLGETDKSEIKQEIKTEQHILTADDFYE